MSYELIERDATRNRLSGILNALESHPSTESYVLDEFTLQDLLNMADVAEYDIELRFKPKRTEQAPSWAR